jgi:Secretion system C-terminal sorting domain
VKGTNSMGINATQYSANGLRIRNNNIFKTGTTTFANTNGTNYTTLATLQASAYGTGTVSIDPNFTTPINLYTSEVGLRAGFPLASVPTDIDGKTRSATVPSMGANEIIVTLDDAGAMAFNAPLVPFAAGTQTVQMSVRNFGVNPLSSVTINWSVNGILQTPYAATGLSVAQSTNSGPLSIGTYNFVLNTPYTLRFWTTNPNGVADANAANDTLLITNIYPALNGVYTIGGMTPDFLNFTQARTNLHAGGMLGNVTFNVRDGKYFEQLTLDSIPNQGNNTVTFQSENLDNSKVYLSYSGVTNDGIYGAVEFRKAKNITIRHISMGIKLPLVFGSTSIANSTTLNSVVALRGGNINIQLLDNQLIDSTNSGSATGVGMKLISNQYGGFSQGYSSALGANDSLITVSNNKLIQVYESAKQTSVVELVGAASQLNTSPFYIVLATLKKITFTNNTYDIKNIAKTGLSLYNIETAVVTNNKVQGNAILGATDNILIDKNTFNHASYDQTAVTLKSSAGRLAGKPFVFSNNMVKTDVVGLFNASYVNNTGVLLDGDRIKMVHNTVATSDTGYTTGYTFGAAIKFGLSGNQFDTLLNNIIFNSNQGYLFLGNLPSNCVANNNLLFSNRISPNAATLAQWQAANVGKDVNSITGINPYFKGAIDLHASNILIKTMPQLAGFATDIDGNLRGSTVCVGADEFTQPTNDAVIVNYAPRKVFPEGNNAITVDIYNNGTAPITSLQFNVGLQNFVQDNTISTNAGSFTYNFNGNIASGATQTINLGNLTIPISRNILKINNVLTNGVADDVPHTDTLQNDMYYCGLNGTYTFRNYNIYSTTTSFNNFELVRKQLKFGGVYGASNLDLIAGLHQGQIIIDSLPNRGALSPLTIRSANNDSINTGIVNSVGQAIDIRNASYITLQKLKIENTTISQVYQSSLTYLYRSHHIKVENCYLKNLNAGATDFGTSGSIGALSVKDLVIKNNYFDTSAVGIILNSNYNDSTTNTIIENNVFNKQREAGIYAYYSKGLIINKNQFYSTSPFYTVLDLTKRYMAINLYGQVGYNEIIRNKIHHTGDGIGINAIYFNPFPLTNDTTLIANNMITVGNNNEAYGMNLNSFGGIPEEMFVYHNSINNISTSVNAVAFKMNSNFAKVRNNIFYNKINGKAADITKSSTYEQNYNLLYSGGATLATVNGSNYANLAALSSGASLDYNSVTGNPLFVSDTDLHADGSTANNNGLFTVTQIVKEDFDGETRNISTPDIGADEFTLPNYGSVALEGPLSSCSHTTTENVKVWVKNFGTTTRTRIPVAYRFNGGTIVRDTANVTLAPNDSTLFTFTQTANLATPIDYNFEVFTEYRGDSLPANDTIKVLVATTSSNNILPYYTGFEGSANGWYSNGQNTSWKWGVIYSGVIDSAANGLNAWKTNLTGPHRNGEVSYLYSPCFDLTTLTQDPIMNFSITYQLDNSDKAWLEISGDGGTSWSKLGATGDGMGWYNASGNVWSGVQQGWTNAKHLIPLSILSDKSKTRFRFVLQTNNSVVQDGFGVDDISIYTTVNKPIANSSGTFTGLTGTSTGSATFVPVNDASGNRIVEINDNGQNLGTITVDVNQNPSGTPTLQNGQYYLGRNFVIKMQNAPTSPVKVRLFITQAEFDALKAADPTLDQVRSLSVVKFNGSIENTSLADNGSMTKLTISPAQISKVPYLDGYFLEFTVSSFSEFYITNGNFLGSPLPLQLTSFTGQQNKGSVLLNWETAQEKDMSHFEVEVSSNGADFVKFDLVKAKNKPYKTTYYATDYSKWASNIKYYRLKMVGIDGKYEYSRVLSFNHKQSIAVSIYPNPAHETVVIDGGKNFKQIQIVDALGKIVRTFTPKESNEYALDGLNTGVYFIRLVNGLEMQIHKLIVE